MTRTTQITVLTANGREQINRPDIVEVYATELFKRDGSRKGYRYTAIMADGSSVVVRNQATRLYENAFMYSGIVATGKSGLASAFTFGKKPLNDSVIETYRIQLEAPQAEPVETAPAPKPVGTCDGDTFAKNVAAWLIDHLVPFRHDYQHGSSLHVFTVDTTPRDLHAAFAYARNLAK